MAKGKPTEPNLEESARKRYATISNPDISFENFVAIERREAFRQQQLAAGVTQLYRRGLPSMTPCGGGDFDAGIDPAQWQGAYGTLPLATGADPFANFTGGLQGGGIQDADSGGVGTAHQTAVGGGTDPIIGIPLTAQGSGGAVRIGNAVNLYGCELLSKTFTVTAAQRIIKFWYAAVFQDPDHDAANQPYFWVRVADASTGAAITGTVDLGNGSDKAVADASNPFFYSEDVEGHGTVVYRDWSCAQINLSGHVGKTVTVEFVTADCGYGGHWGYAYVDNFCGDCRGSPGGNFNFAASESTACGVGKLCFDYELPFIRYLNGPIKTGAVEIKLDLLQNGAVVASLTSGPLTAGTSYCFDIDPAAIGGLDPALDGFDFVATANFSVGTTSLAPMSFGGAPDGVHPGTNNDYKLACTAFSYAVKFVCGTQQQCNCACAPVRPGLYATEINIFNPNDEAAEIDKFVIPVVNSGAVVGREPRVVQARAEDRIVLPAYSATMDDCCRLAELLLGAPAEGCAAISLGFLEIVSPVELVVTAVYTASGPEGGPVSIDVETIMPRPRKAVRHRVPGPGSASGSGPRCC